MNNYYEPDTVRCQAIKNDGKRCTFIGTHSNGGKVLCERHHQMHVAMTAPVKTKEVKK